eukprot:gene8399-14377_t
MASKTNNLEKIDWSNELVEKLIDVVQNKEVVWKKFHTPNRNKNAQEWAWMETAKSLGLEGRPTCVKEKWRDLRDTYRKRLKADCGKSGDAGDLKRMSWPWMQAMDGAERCEDLTTINCSQIGQDWESEAGHLTPASPLPPHETNNLAKIDWSNELVEKLIDVVQNKEVVWKKFHTPYRNKNAQEWAWMETAKSLGLEGRPTCVREKWRDLRDTYRKKLKADCGKSGDAGGLKRMSWPWMQAMDSAERCEDLTTINCFQIGQDWESEAGDLTPASPLPPPESSDHSNSECVTPIMKMNVFGKRKKKTSDYVDFAILEELRKITVNTIKKRSR